MKKCRRCNIEKSFDNFSKANREKDGLQDRCKSCNKIVAAEYRKNNSEKERMRHAKYHVENKENINARVSKWQKENPEKMRVKAKRFYDNNKEKEKERRKKWIESNPEWIKNYSKQYAQTNKHIICKISSKRRAILKNAFVSWANEDKINEFYKKAAELTMTTGIPHEVDHIIPLQSKYICGLHVENNLQILTRQENNFKRNKFKPS